jgi:hypothetical protein
MRSAYKSIEVPMQRKAHANQMIAIKTIQINNLQQYHPPKYCPRTPRGQ